MLKPTFKSYARDLLRQTCFIFLFLFFFGLMHVKFKTGFVLISEAIELTEFLFVLFVFQQLPGPQRPGAPQQRGRPRNRTRSSSHSSISSHSSRSSFSSRSRSRSGSRGRSVSSNSSFSSGSSSFSGDSDDMYAQLAHTRRKSKFGFGNW